MIGWTEPNINWDENDRVTASDMNRIGGNLNYLLNNSTKEQIKETWTSNDYVTLNDWEKIINAVTSLMLWVSLPGIIPGNECNADNFNLVEQRISEMKIPVELRFKQTGEYVGLGKHVGSGFVGGY